MLRYIKRLIFGAPPLPDERRLVINVYPDGTMMIQGWSRRVSDSQVVKTTF